MESRPCDKRHQLMPFHLNDAIYSMNKRLQTESVKTTSVENESTWVLCKNKNTIWDVQIGEIYGKLWLWEILWELC